MTQSSQTFSPGQRVTVTQQVPTQRGGFTIAVEGIVVGLDQRKTGSWYAHSKDDKLWLDRLVIRKDDGEIIKLVLDQYTHIDVIGDAPAAKKNDSSVQDSAGQQEESA